MRVEQNLQFDLVRFDWLDSGVTLKKVHHSYTVESTEACTLTKKLKLISFQTFIILPRVAVIYF